MYQKSLSIAEHMKRESFPDKDFKLRFVVSRERLGFIFGIKGEWQKALDTRLYTDSTAPETSLTVFTDALYHPRLRSKPRHLSPDGPEKRGS